MDALTFRYGGEFGPWPTLLYAPVAANTLCEAGRLGCVNSSGYAVPSSDSDAQTVWGLFTQQQDNRTSNSPYGAAGAKIANILPGADLFLNDGTIAQGNVGQDIFLSDDTTSPPTVSLNSAGGTKLRVGYLLPFPPATGSPDAGKPTCSRTRPSPHAARSTAEAFTARAVATSIAAYAGTGTGALTKSTNGALAAQDGLTIVVGDIIFLPHGLTNVQAADVGPWLVTGLGGTSSKWTLVRPSWWQHGSAIPLVSIIQIGPSGTSFKNYEWRATTTGTIDTTDPLFYPRVQKGTGAVGTQVTGLYALSGAGLSAMDVTANHSVLPTLVAGNGTGTLDFTGTGTDAINWMVINY